jgi:hypothetical protein
MPKQVHLLKVTTLLKTEVRILILHLTEEPESTVAKIIGENLFCHELNSYGSDAQLRGEEAVPHLLLLTVGLPILVIVIVVPLDAWL